jgi:uncharacterized protein (DUF58 family)
MSSINSYLPQREDDRVTATTHENATLLRGDAEKAAGALPPLLVAASRLAATILLGAHGRRKAGPGETFWQYRRAVPGDAASSIDWRRSARSDALFVRETEWEQPQTVWFWRDGARSMNYRSNKRLQSKSETAALIVATLAVLLTRGGERIAAVGGGASRANQAISEANRPKSGERQLERVVAALAAEDGSDYGEAPLINSARGGRAVFVSDFFGDEALLQQRVAILAAAGVSGFLIQVLDPAEEIFPFNGRVLFESMAGDLRYDAAKAQSLKEAYRRELAARRERLRALARRTGWTVRLHRTDEPVAPLLLDIARRLSGGVGRGWG